MVCLLLKDNHEKVILTDVLYCIVMRKPKNLNLITYNMKKIKAYRNTQILEHYTIKEPHNCAECEKKRQRKWHKLHALRANNHSLQIN